MGSTLDPPERLMTAGAPLITSASKLAADSPADRADLKAGGERISVRSPASGKVIGQVPVSTAADVADLVRGLRQAQTTWESGGLETRIGHLLRLRDWLLSNPHALTKMVQDETGKPWQEASIEVPLSCDFINYYCRNAQSFLAGSHPRPHSLLTASKRLSITHRPYPVVGVISAWNFPLVLPLMDCLPALLAGAAVVAKPSEVTPLALGEVVRAWTEEIGGPAVFACAQGTGEVGRAVVDHVDYVQFTGSTRSGRAVAVRAAERLIPCSLELGGKDAAIVLADADLDRAVNGVMWGAFANAGQVCLSIERVYVEAPIYDAFVEKLIERVRSLRVGPDDGRFKADVGALATETQLEIVRRQVDEAVAQGARAVTGGRPVGTGTFFEPTVLLDVDHSMTCMREETFGPTLPVMRVRDVDEAVRLANDSPYGLSATVWTASRRRAEAVAHRLEVGAVNVNDAFSNFLCFPLPHAGWKSSGIGSRLGGAQGILKYCRPQVMTTPRLGLRRELTWYPYTARVGRPLLAAMRLLASRGPRAPRS